jgi:hypothetical protein
MGLKILTNPEILVGVPLFVIAAVPPEPDNTKSLTCNAPLPPLVLNTPSVIVTAMVLLSAAKETDEIVAGDLSFNATVLLYCNIAASFPE